LLKENQRGFTTDTAPSGTGRCARRWDKRQGSLYGMAPGGIVRSTRRWRENNGLGGRWRLAVSGYRQAIWSNCAWVEPGENTVVLCFLGVLF